MGYFILISIAVLLTACNGLNSKTAAATIENVEKGALASIAQLPKITDPVVESNSAQMQRIRLQTAAGSSSGTALRDFNTKDWSSQGGLERAACESARLYREVLERSIESSKIQCYLGAMLQEEKFDGHHHYFDMGMMEHDRDDPRDRGPPGEGEYRGPPPPPPGNQQFQSTPETSFKVKIKALRDSNGNIANFEVFACSDGSQEMYGRQSITTEGVSVSMAFKDEDARGRESFSHMGNMEAIGTINSSGDWISKRVVAQMTESGSHYSNPNGEGLQLFRTESSGLLQLDEAPNYILLSGFHHGNFGREIFKEQFLTAMGVIYPTDREKDILGRVLTDGSAKRIFERSYDGQDDSHYENAHWNADLTHAKNSRFTDLLGGNPPEIKKIQTGFSAEQSWDCQGDFEIFEVDTSQMQKFDQCDAISPIEQEWINCWAQEQYIPPEDPHQKNPPGIQNPDEIPIAEPAPEAVPVEPVPEAPEEVPTVPLPAPPAAVAPPPV